MPLHPVLIIQRHFITFVVKFLKDNDYVYVFQKYPEIFALQLRTPKFQCFLFLSKRSYICYISCMTVPFRGFNSTVSGKICWFIKKKHFCNPIPDKGGCKHFLVTLKNGCNFVAFQSYLKEINFRGY